MTPLPASSEQIAGPSTRRPALANGAIPIPAKSASAPFPTVEHSVSVSTDIWARDLRSLFEHARDRFADVSWESEEGGDRVWGHKGACCAHDLMSGSEADFASSCDIRPCTQFVTSSSSLVAVADDSEDFKDRYFITRPFSRSPTSLRSPSPHVIPPLFTSSRPTSPPSSYFRSSPYPGRTSSLSVNTFASEGTVRYNDGGINLGNNDGVLRLTHGDTPEMFQAQLEWLYTGEGFGDVVEWISDENDIAIGVSNIRDSLGRRGDVHERRDKLGQDLTYMWRSKLYADVRIHLETSRPSSEEDSDASDDSTDSLSSTLVFTAHKAILASRSPYFSSVLLNTSNFLSTSNDDIYLPTPPFTPAALHYCLGYMYAGHLDFSNRTFDLATAFQIHRAAAYLQLDPLIGEVESRIVYDFCHGLDKRRCKCRKCPLRIARVWRFASASDVGAVELARKSRAFVVSSWGDTWGREIGTADENDRRSLVRDVIEQTTFKNVIAAIKNVVAVKERIEVGLRSKGRDAAQWVENLEAMVEAIQSHIRRILVSGWAKIAEGSELWDVLEGKGFSDDLLDIIGDELSNGLGTTLGCVEGPRVYQALVASILLKVDPDTLQTVLSPRGRPRQKVEGIKNKVVLQIKRRWMQVRDGGGFDGVENWAVKEISDEISVPVDDLLSALDLAPSTPVAELKPKNTSAPRQAFSTVAQRALSGEQRSTRVSLPGRLSSPAAARPTSPPDSNGLRRLRLSSSASAASVTSQRSRATPTRPAEQVTGPRARSPTAERQGPVVSIGAGRRPRPSNSESTALAQPSQTRSMSGPPRQLLTRYKATSTSSSTPNGRSSPAPSVASTQTARARPSNTSLAPPLPLSSTRAGASSKKKEDQGAESSRTRSTSSSTLASARRPLAERKDPASATAAKTGAPVLRVTKPANGLSKTADGATPPGRDRTASMSTTASVRSRLSTVSKAPTVGRSTGPSHAPQSSTANGAPSGKTPTANGKPPLSIRKLPSTGSLASRTTIASRAAASRPPVPPVPKLPAKPKPPITTTNTATTTSSPPKPLPRDRTTSAASTQSSRRRAPPAVAFPSSPLAVPALRSASSSTDDGSVIRTPRISSQHLAAEPKIIRQGSDYDVSSTTPSPTKTHYPHPPVSLVMPRTARKTSATSVRSATSARHHLHPASAFDPPRRREDDAAGVLAKDRAVPTGLVAFAGKGVQLNVGIPCIVSLKSRRARFRAAIKYLGHLDNSRGAWVGLECDDLERLGVATLETGSIGSTFYFHLSDPLDLHSSVHDENRQARKRRVEAIRESLRAGKKGRANGVGLGITTDPVGRSISPFVEPHAGFENPRALFVRPSEIVYVIGAE